MCGFEVGDQVVCVDASGAAELTAGATYTISRIVVPGDRFVLANGNYCVSISPVGVWVVGGFDFSAQTCERPWSSYEATRFRKVQRRDLTEWLKTATKFEEPKRGKVSA